MSSEVIRNMEAQVEQTKVALEKYTKIEDMIVNNEAFGLFIETYTKDEAYRISEALTGTNKLSKEVIETLQEKQLGIRHFNIFLNKIKVEKMSLESCLVDLDEYINGVRSGDILLEVGEE